MTEQTPTPDPWVKVEYERGLMGDTPSVQYDRRSLVDAARSADAAQIARLTQELAKLDNAAQEERSAAVRAEVRAEQAEQKRDAAQQTAESYRQAAELNRQQIATLTEQLREARELYEANHG